MSLICGISVAYFGCFQSVASEPGGIMCCNDSGVFYLCRYNYTGVPNYTGVF